MTYGTSHLLIGGGGLQSAINITIIQVYAPTSGHDDSEVDHFYQQLQETIDKTPKKDILVVQGDWNA